MDKDEIKKALECCCNSDFNTACRNCQYLTHPRCNDMLCKDALTLINEQENEIERLKDKCEELRNEKWNAQDDLDCYCDEMPNKIKRAKIDMLNELKEKLDSVPNGWAYTTYIDELIKDIENVERS